MPWGDVASLKKWHFNKSKTDYESDPFSAPARIISPKWNYAKIFKKQQGGLSACIRSPRQRGPKRQIFISAWKVFQFCSGLMEEH